MVYNTNKSAALKKRMKITVAKNTAKLIRAAKKSGKKSGKKIISINNKEAAKVLGVKYKPTKKIIKKSVPTIATITKKVNNLKSNNLKNQSLLKPQKVFNSSLVKKQKTAKELKQIKSDLTYNKRLQRLSDYEKAIGKRLQKAEDNFLLLKDTPVNRVIKKVGSLPGRLVLGGIETANLNIQKGLAVAEGLLRKKNRGYVIKELKRAGKETPAATLDFALERDEKGKRHFTLNNALNIATALLMVKSMGKAKANTRSIQAANKGTKVKGVRTYTKGKNTQVTVKKGTYKSKSGIQRKFDTRIEINKATGKGKYITRVKDMKGKLLKTGKGKIKTKTTFKENNFQTKGYVKGKGGKSTFKEKGIINQKNIVKNKKGVSYTQNKISDLKIKGKGKGNFKVSRKSKIDSTGKFKTTIKKSMVDKKGNVHSKHIKTKTTKYTPKQLKESNILNIKRKPTGKVKTTVKTGLNKALKKYNDLKWKRYENPQKTSVLKNNFKRLMKDKKGSFGGGNTFSRGFGNDILGNDFTGLQNIKGTRFLKSGKVKTRVPIKTLFRNKYNLNTGFNIPGNIELMTALGNQGGLIPIIPFKSYYNERTKNPLRNKNKDTIVPKPEDNINIINKLKEINDIPVDTQPTPENDNEPIIKPDTEGGAGNDVPIDDYSSPQNYEDYIYEHINAPVPPQDVIMPGLPNIPLFPYMKGSLGANYKRQRALLKKLKRTADYQDPWQKITGKIGNSRMNKIMRKMYGNLYV